MRGGKTVVLHHPLCLDHHSCPPIKRSGGDPPPENVKRLEVIYNEVRRLVAARGVLYWAGSSVVVCGASSTLELRVVLVAFPWTGCEV